MSKHTVRIPVLVEGGKARWFAEDEPGPETMRTIEINGEEFTVHYPPDFRIEWVEMDEADL